MASFDASKKEIAELDKFYYWRNAFEREFR